MCLVESSSATLQEVGVFVRSVKGFVAGFDSKWRISTRNLGPVELFREFTFYLKFVFCLNMFAFVVDMMMCE